MKTKLMLAPDEAALVWKALINHRTSLNDLRMQYEKGPAKERFGKTDLYIRWGAQVEVLDGILDRLKSNEAVTP